MTPLQRCMLVHLLPVLLGAGAVTTSGHGQETFDALVKQLRLLPVEARSRVVTAFLAHRRTPIVENDSVVTFVWFGSADTVFVNGSLQSGWRRPESMDRLVCGTGPGHRSLFFRRYVVPADAHLEYQFVIDGRSVLDSTNVRTTPDGDFRNSQVVMPMFRPTPWTRHRPEVPRGKYDTLLFRPRDPRVVPRRVIVYTPPGHSAGAGAPSVYIHDGETAATYAFLPRILDNLLHEKVLPGVVAVFIPPVERQAEYLGVKQVLLLDALADELVPMINARYGTSPSARDRAIMGISSGGHAALVTGLARSDVFGLCAGQSSTITGALHQLAALRTRYAPLPLSFRLYLECGRFDIISGELHFPQLNREFHERLRACRIGHVYRETSGGHDWPSWRETMPDILLYFFAHNGAPPDVLPDVRRLGRP